MARRPRRRPITAEDLAGYGSPVASVRRARGAGPRGRSDEVAAPVDEAAAARGLGVSLSAVRRAISATAAQLGTAVFRVLSGRPTADVSAEASPGGLLAAAFGRGPRGGAVNARAAADALGVSPTTVRRWAAGTQAPSKGHLADLRRTARRMTDTQKGRRAATADLRSAVAAGPGTRKIVVYGEQGVVGKNPDSGVWDYYSGQRRVAVSVPAADIDCGSPGACAGATNLGDDRQCLMHAYEQTGLPGALDTLTAIFDRHYTAGWQFTSIDEFNIE